MSAEVWANAVQTIALLVAGGAAVFAYRQSRLARHGGGGANVLQLWYFAQSDAARLHRRALYAAVERAGRFDPAAANWTETEIEAARHVCQVWSVTGALARRDLVPCELVVDEWGPAISRTWALAGPVVTHERARSSDMRLFANFEWLAAEARHSRLLRCP